ncbi:MAG: DUF481 domain-containing protein [Planctomycetota bacterium]
MNARNVTLAITLGLVGASAAATEHEAAERPIELGRLSSIEQPEDAAALAAQEAAPDFAQQGFFDGWTGDVTLGLNGADGNAQRNTIRLGASANKETTKWKLTNAIVYANSQDDGEESEDRFRADFRQERKLDNKPRWSAFVREEYTYDEFDNFLHRFGAFGGVGYKAIDREKYQLKFIGGAGTLYETGNGTEPGFFPEAFGGVELDWQITEKQKFHFDNTSFFDIAGANEVRNVTNLTWEVLVDEAANLSLKSGFRNEYDSGAQSPNVKNDIEYFLLLAFSY